MFFDLSPAHEPSHNLETCLSANKPSTQLLIQQQFLPIRDAANIKNPVTNGFAEHSNCKVQCSKTSTRKSRKLPKAGMNPLIPLRASQPLARIARTGRGKDAAQDSGGIRGVFSFGYFSLDKQRKVSRLSVREPTLKSASRSVSLMIDASV
jgi:hypothetical protein